MCAHTDRGEGEGVSGRQRDRETDRHMHTLSQNHFCELVEVGCPKASKKKNITYKHPDLRTGLNFPAVTLDAKEKPK